jgi:hypothetical protein
MPCVFRVYICLWMTPGCMLTLAPASPLLSLCLSSIASSSSVRLVGGTEEHDRMHGLTFTNTASRPESVATIAWMQLGLPHSPPSMNASMHEDALALTSASDLSAAPTNGWLMPHWWTKQQGPSLIEWRVHCRKSGDSINTLPTDRAVADDTATHAKDQSLRGVLCAAMQPCHSAESEGERAIASSTLTLPSEEEGGEPHLPAGTICDALTASRCDKGATAAARTLYSRAPQASVLHRSA